MISILYSLMTKKPQDILNKFNGIATFNIDASMSDDDFIANIDAVSEELTISTLFALEVIYSLRLQLANVSLNKDKAINELLCRDRLSQLLKIFKKKYATSKSINEKIEILERMEIISLNLYGEHSFFALEEASLIEDEVYLTNNQKLRLDWISAISLSEGSNLVTEILSKDNGSFEMGILAQVMDYFDRQERTLVINRYFELLDNAISAQVNMEIGKLLVIAAPWNKNPYMRSVMKKINDRTALITGLSVPEKCVNPIAADIYVRMESIMRRYDETNNTWSKAFGA